ncbi:transcriptional regulator, ArsR family [Amycolatopsis marina]|uniref:Transcriptional regulator, ArsR family n=1 Tax=Amycolatopsis marina TaxID=490629 RepID=A0A1I1C0Z9_9PSEU|nr:metalloregulator ArsR/SmtB family transcription factor [Amycolatopsis marina]SFB55666.1 transcriptional regulator, ArsR family [Amycolatopsis marina]
MDTFQAVADPVRRSIIERLASGEASAGELAEHTSGEFGISQPATSKHLRALREAGLVSSTIAAQRRIYRLDPRPLADIADWAHRQHRFWSDRLDTLENQLLASGNPTDENNTDKETT